MSKLNLGTRYFIPGRSIKSLNETQEGAKQTVEKLIEDGIYEFESIPCLCASSVENDLLVAAVDRYGLKHHTVICRACGLVRTNPRLTRASYRNFYQEWYRQLYSGWQHLDENRFINQFNSYLPRGEKIAAFLLNNQIDIAGKKVLEIGCGGGWNLPALEKAGAVATGFDYGNYTEFGKELYDLDLHCGGSREAMEKGIKANVVILSHTIEHFSDPIEELNNLKKLLDSDGVCYLETPGVLNIHNSYVDPLKYLQNAHTYSFSKHTLSGLIKRCGYEVQYCDEYIRMLCRPAIAGCVNIKAKPQHSRLVIDYLRDCERKRIVRGCQLFLKRFAVSLLKILGIYPWARKMYHKANPNSKTD